MPGETVLVVEGEASAGVEIPSALERLGYRVAGLAVSGEEALARCQAQPVDLVLMGIRLRGSMSGIEAGALLRDRFGVPVVYHGADLDLEGQQRAGMAAPFSYLARPFQEQALGAVLEMALHCHRLEAALSDANRESERHVAHRARELQETTERLRKEMAERRQAQDALRESGALSQQIVDGAQEGIVVYDRDQRIRTWNPFMVQLTGVPAGDALGRRASDLFPFLRDQGVVASIDRALAGGTPAPIDFPYQLPDGRSGWAMDTTSPLRDAEGRVAGAIGIVHVITDRKESEHEIRRLNETLEARVAERTARLAESEAWLRAILASVPEAVVTIEDDGKVASFNPAAERAFGYAAAEVVGRDLTLLMPSPSRGEPDEEHIVGSVREAEGRRRDGTVFPIEVWVREMEHEGRRVLVATLRDITERKRADESLRASEARYRLLFDRNLAGVYRSTLDGRIIDCNDAFARIYGYASRAELEGRDAHELYPSPAVRGAFIARLMQTGELVNSEFAGRRKDGSMIWTLENVSLMAEGVIEGTLVDVTERRRAEEALRESEERFRGLAEAAFEGIAFTERGRVVDVNRQAAEMLGYGVAEMIGRSVLDFIGAESAAEVEERMRSGSEGPYEHLLRRKDGSTFPAEAHARAFRLQGRQLRVTALRDISQRKRAEEEQARLSRAVAQAGESIVITDPEGTIVYVNPAFERITGYARAEVVGRNPRILKSGRQDAAVYRNMWETLVQGGVWSGRLVNRRKDGTLFDEDATIGPVRDASGRLVNYVAVKRDVTSEAQLQEALRAAADEWQRSFDSIDVALVLTGEDGRILRLNQAAQRLSGRDYSELVGSDLRELPPSGLWRQAAELARQPTDAPVPRVSRISDADSGLTWDVRVSRIADPDQERSRRLIVAAVDVTETVRMEEAVRRGQTMAAIGSLASGVAHEVRGPLFALSANLDALDADPALAERLTPLRRSAVRLNTLMEDLLDFARPHTSHFVKRPFAEPIQEARGDCAAMAEREGVSIVSGPDPARSVMMDRDRLRQVFTNTLQNAIHHTPRSGTVRIEFESILEDSREWVRCLVSDQGPGFREEDLERAFEPFYTRRKGGTGLGLAIAKRIVQDHQGRIEARNRPGRGACLIVALPVAGE